MLKKSTVLYFLFVMITLLFPFLVSGLDYVTTTGTHVYSKLRADDVAEFITDSANLTRWIGHIDLCYEKLNDLTNYVPYAEAPYNGIIGIESSDEDGNGASAIMGNPITWYRAHIRDNLSLINDDDNWCWAIIHELSHDFDHDNWNFHSEVLGTFKALYIFDKEVNEYTTAEKAGLIESFEDDYDGANDAFTQFGIVRPSVEYWLIVIQQIIGWDPFEQAFAQLLISGNPSDTGAQKFMALLTALDDNSVYDVIHMIPTDQLNQIKHFLDKGELSKWDTNNFINDAHLIAYKDTQSGEIRLTWENIVNYEDGYEIEYSVNGGSYQYLDEVGVDVIEYTNSSLSPTNTYEFRIRAYSESSHITYRGYSFYSNEASEVDVNNVSVLKPVTVDNGTHGDYAVDGIVNTMCDIPGAEPHYVTVDLRDLILIDQVIIKHAGVNGFPIYNTRDYKIQTSLDSVNWTDVKTVTGNTSDITTDNLPQPVYAAYVRLYITKATSTSDPTALIAEIDVRRSTASNPLVNVALNKTATADVPWVPGEVPGNTVDGTVENNSKWCSTSGSQHYLEVDMEQGMSISYVVIKHGGTKEPADTNSREFTIKIAQTADNWQNITPIFSVTDNTSDITYHALGSPQQARYIRLDLIHPTQSSDNTVRIYELEVWGEEQQASGFEVLYRDDDRNATNAEIKPCFKIVNDSGASVNLVDFKIKYWYTIDTAAAQNFVCDYAAAGSQNVTGTFTAVDPARTGADYCLEVTFSQNAGSLANGGNSEVKTRFYKNGWISYNEANDYSNDNTKTDYASWNKVTLYRNGQLVWGTEP